MACPWNGSQCGCGASYVPPPDDHNRFACWLPDQHGKMPAECERRTPLTMVSMYLREVSADKRSEYDCWVKAGRPKLTEWYGVPDDETSEGIP